MRAETSQRSIDFREYVSKCGCLTSPPKLRSVIRIQGWVYKRGAFNTGYKKRYLVLKGNLLFYLKMPKDKVRRVTQMID